MTDPKFSMLVESFMEHAKKQDQSALDGAMFIFLPRDSQPTDASMFSWVSDDGTKQQSQVWHDIFVAMLFALFKTGVDLKTIKEMADHAAEHVERVTANLTDADDINEVIN
jgi:hypothetical protein